MIEFDNIVKKYADFTFQLNMTLTEQRIIGIIGRNGSGKTTLFRLLAELIFPTKGTIRIDSVNIQQFTAEQKQKIVTLFADVDGFALYTLQELVSFWRAFYPTFATEKFFEQVDYFELPREQPLSEFSKGMKATVKILLALYSNAEIILLDEPTNGLDVVARDELLTLIQERFATATLPMTIIVSSHTAADIEQICDEVLLFDNGRMILQADTDEIIAHYAVLKIPADELSLMDQTYLLHIMPHDCGYLALTDQGNFYRENYRQIVVERASVDDIVRFLTGGAQT